MNDRGDNNIFKDIIKDNWSEFKKVSPKYDCLQYEDAINKMISCGSELGGSNLGSGRRVAVILHIYYEYFGWCYGDGDSARFVDLKMGILFLFSEKNS